LLRKLKSHIPFSFIKHLLYKTTLACSTPERQCTVNFLLCKPKIVFFFALKAGWACSTPGGSVHQ
jgi:hypothetical protein